jgi:hypothetical protein
MKAPIAADDFQSAVVDDHAVANRAAFGRRGRSARLRTSEGEGGGAWRASENRIAVARLTY